jgi:MFS family permease
VVEINSPTNATRSFAFAWGICLLFYVLEYATRSAPAVMIPEISAAFGLTAAGVGSVLGAYYYSYSVTSLFSGVILDRTGAKYALSCGVAVLGVGCLLFSLASPATALAGRLLQGAGSSFAFTGAVYLASRAFRPQSLATAIGVTQCLGMLGGSAGQFLVGPLMQIPVPWNAVWLFFGCVGLGLAVILLGITPAGHQNRTFTSGASQGILQPYKIVLSNPQSYLCGIIAGLLFVPTTIGDMTWGVAFFQHGFNLDFHHAITVVSMVPLGWVVGCPLAGWAADRIGLRKPVLVVGAVIMLMTAAQITMLPELISPTYGMLAFGIASGVAMVPYTIIKEGNPDEVKGCATGILNFLNFGISAVVGQIFGAIFGRTLQSNDDPASYFRHAGLFWMAAISIAILLSFLLQETGRRSVAQVGLATA